MYVYIMRFGNKICLSGKWVPTLISNDVTWARVHGDRVS